MSLILEVPESGCPLSGIKRPARAMTIRRDDGLRLRFVGVGRCSNQLNATRNGLCARAPRYCSSLPVELGARWNPPCESLRSAPKVKWRLGSRGEASSPPRTLGRVPVPANPALPSRCIFTIPRLISVRFELYIGQHPLPCSSSSSTSSPSAFGRQLGAPQPLAMSRVFRPLRSMFASSRVAARLPAGQTVRIERVRIKQASRARRFLWEQHCILQLAW